MQKRLTPKSQKKSESDNWEGKSIKTQSAGEFETESA